MARAEIPPAHAGHGWLAAIVPAGARSFRVTDSALELALSYAGAAFVEERPDVEIAPADEIRGGAGCAVVVIAEERPEGALKLVRRARRVGRSLVARSRAAHAARTLRARGYGRVGTLPWALDRPFPLPGRDPAPVRLPVWALVVGHRGMEPEPSILEAAAEAAGVQLEQLPNVRQGVVVVMAEEGVLRVAIGPAERQIDEQALALERFRELRPDPALDGLAPRVLGAGRSGLARWALEKRLAGRRPELVDERLRDECVEFLAELFRLGASSRGSDPGERASVVASQCDARETAPLEALGARLTQSLEGVQRGFAHGDFWSENLLVDGGRLSGVVDWDYAGEGRLPLLDLFHLLVNEERRKRRTGLGPAIADWLLPSLGEGGEPEVRELSGLIGLDAGPGLLTDLALAYWLDYVARQLELYADRAARPVWMRDNVSVVLRAATT